MRLCKQTFFSVGLALSAIFAGALILLFCYPVILLSDTDNGIGRCVLGNVYFCPMKRKPKMEGGERGEPKRKRRRLEDNSKDHKSGCNKCDSGTTTNCLVCKVFFFLSFSMLAGRQILYCDTCFHVLYFPSKPCNACEVCPAFVSALTSRQQHVADMLRMVKPAAGMSTVTGQQFVDLASSVVTINQQYAACCLHAHQEGLGVVAFAYFILAVLANLKTAEEEVQRLQKRAQETRRQW